MSHLAASIRRAQTRISPVQTLSGSIPSPILGWNQRDPLGEMDPRFATIMDNYFPDGRGLRLRNGYVDHVTGFTGPVQSLHTSIFGQQDKLVAFVDNNAYDVTTQSSTPGTPLATGFTVDYWNGINAGVQGSEVSIFTNGADPAQQWDGATWQQSGLTGPSKFGYIALSKKRVWVVEFGTGKAWYWPPEATSGAGSAFDIQSVHPRGGELIAIGELTIDGGNGPEDLTVFIQRSGAVILYAGTDPSDAAAWSLVGIWQAGIPLDYRPLVPFGNDLILITNAGFQSLNQFTQTGRIAGSIISDNIKLVVEDSARFLAGNFPWSGIYYPFGRQLIFVIPVQQEQVAHQYVMNTATGAWCRFTGQNPFSHAVRQNGDLYYGTAGKVIRADVGGIDGDTAIEGDYQTAWNYMGNRGREKHFKQFRPNLITDSNVNLEIFFGVDFRTPEFSSSASIGPPPAGKWDSGKWNEAKWGSGSKVTQDWRGAAAHGFNAAIRYKTNTIGANIEFLATDLNYELGGFI